MDRVISLLACSAIASYMWPAQVRYNGSREHKDQCAQRKGWQLRYRLIAALAATAVLAGTLLGTTSAQASCTVSIKAPNVHVSSTTLYSVKATLTNACGAVDASWDMDHGTQVIGGWLFWNGGSPLRSGQTETAYYVPGFSPLGTYHAEATGAQDANSNSIPQNTYRFYVKLSSRISISGYRSGRRVYVRAHITRFSTSANYGLGGWVNSRDRRVGFYYYRSGWHWVATRYTGRNGYTGYVRIYAPTHRSFRAHVNPTSTAWDRTSKSIYR